MSKSVEMKRRAAENLLAEAAEQEALEQRFGHNDDYEENCVITWRRQFQVGGPVYTYVAVKLSGRWFVTGQQGNQCHNMSQMVERHLQYALNDEVFIVTEWSELV